MPYTIETEMYDNSFSEIQIMEFFEQHLHADDVWRILFFFIPFVSLSTAFDGIDVFTVATHFVHYICDGLTQDTYTNTVPRVSSLPSRKGTENGSERTTCRSFFPDASPHNPCVTYSKYQILN